MQLTTTPCYPWNPEQLALLSIRMQFVSTGYQMRRPQQPYTWSRATHQYSEIRPVNGTREWSTAKKHVNWLIISFNSAKHHRECKYEQILMPWSRDLIGRSKWHHLHVSGLGKIIDDKRKIDENVSKFYQHCTLWWPTTFQVGVPLSISSCASVCPYVFCLSVCHCLCLALSYAL